MPIKADSTVWDMKEGSRRRHLTFLQLPLSPADEVEDEEDVECQQQQPDDADGEDDDERGVVSTLGRQWRHHCNRHTTIDTVAPTNQNVKDRGRCAITRDIFYQQIT